MADTPVPETERRSRAVIWVGVMLGTALAVLAMTDGVRLRIGGIPAFFGWILGGLTVWAITVGFSVLIAELLRRHHRAIGRYAADRGKRGAVAAGGLAGRGARAGVARASRWAGPRWDDRKPGAPGGREYGPSLPQRTAAWWRRRRGSPADVPAPEQSPAGSATPGDRPSYSYGPADSRFGWPMDDQYEARKRAAIMSGDGKTRVVTEYPPGGGPGTNVAAYLNGEELPPEDIPPIPGQPAPGVAPEEGNGGSSGGTGEATRPPLTPALEQEIKRQVCDWGAADGIEPGEVIVGEDGSITIDRRRNSSGSDYYRSATPMTDALRWTPLDNDGARVYDLKPLLPEDTPNPVPVPPALEEGIKQHICASPWAVAEGLQPDEVIVGPYGSITIDRHRRDPEAKPRTGGMRWEPTPNGDAHITATFPAGGTPPSTDHPHETGGSDMTEQPINLWPTNGVSRRPPAAAAARADVGAAWKALTTVTADFEPEDDEHLLTWMAGETAGMTIYAESLTDVYETCVNGLGLDPVSMQALHEYAESAAEAAQAMATARQKFAAHYKEVREFAASGGKLPFNGRWVTGEGDA